MIISWAAKYIGLPFKDGAAGPDEFDCWGLMTWIYKHEFDIDLNTEMVYRSDRDKIKALAKNFKRWHPMSIPSMGDGVLMLIGGKVPHCGIYIGEGKMLHTFEGAMSCIQRIDSPLWKSRFEGYYTYS